MYQVMMQQITNDRINNARQQAEAHRLIQQTKTKSAGAVDKVTLRQNSGIASRLLAAARQLNVWRTFSFGKKQQLPDFF